MSNKTDKPKKTAPQLISKMKNKGITFRAKQRQKKLSCRPMLEFTALLYTYNRIVSDQVKHHRMQELKNLFFERMLYRKEFFQKNELIKSNYEFACKVINSL